jgi:hypothetical protein
MVRFQNSSSSRIQAKVIFVGDVVRWSPDELSFSSAAAWKDIYLPQKSREIFLKDPKFYVIDDEYVFSPSTSRTC